MDFLLRLAEYMVGKFTKDYAVNPSAKRGLAYYLGDGFEISCPKLGAQKQVLAAREETRANQP